MTDEKPILRAQRYRSIWISDLHLGTPGCKADSLLEFLRRTESDYLYLVGDVVNGWQARHLEDWPQTHGEVVRLLLRKAREGTRVVYLPGKHDDMAARFGAMAFGGIRIENETIHLTADGSRLLVIHGHLFDGIVRYTKWLACFGDGFHSSVLESSRRLSDWLAGPTLRDGSPARRPGIRAGKAPRNTARFQEALTAEARRFGLDGVVCGHVHKPEIRPVQGVLYCNAGDWVESLTALVETDEGELCLVDRHALRLPGVARVRRPPQVVPTPVNVRPRFAQATASGVHR